MQEEIEQMWNGIEECAKPGVLEFRHGGYPIGYKNVNPNCPQGYYYSALTVVPTDEPEFSRLGWKFGEERIFLTGKTLDEIKEKITNYVTSQIK